MAYIAGNPLLTVSRQLWEGAATSGQTSISIPGGFTPGMCDVYVGGAALSVGDYDDSNGSSINLTKPMAAGTQYRIVMYAPGSAVVNGTPYGASMNYVTPAAGVSFIPFTHTVGFAWLMMRGVFLAYNVDYTDSATGFTLVGFTADGVETFSIFSVNPVTMANVLQSNSPIINSGVLQFADGTQQITAPRSNRNYIVDGNFDNWVATSAALPFAGGYVGPVVLTVSCGTNGAGSIAQNVIVGGEAAGMTSPVYNTVTFTITTAQTGAVPPYMMHSMESVRTLQNRSATFSCWLWVASGTQTITKIIVRQNFGSSGSALMTLDIPVNWVVTTTMKRFSVRLDFPSIAGKTIGNNDCISVGIFTPSNATYSLGTGQWQLEQSSPTSSSDINGNGGAPTPFEYRGFQAELARVQRLFLSLSMPFMISNGYSAYNGCFVEAYQKVSQRIMPAVSLIGTPTGNATGGITLYSRPDSIGASFATAQAVNLYYDGINVACDARY